MARPMTMAMTMAIMMARATQGILAALAGATTAMSPLGFGSRSPKSGNVDSKRKRKS